MCRVSTGGWRGPGAQRMSAGRIRGRVMRCVGASQAQLRPKRRARVQRAPVGSGARTAMRPTCPRNTRWIAPAAAPAAAS